MTPNHNSSPEIITQGGPLPTGTISRVATVCSYNDELATHYRYIPTGILASGREVWRWEAPAADPYLLAEAAPTLTHIPGSGGAFLVVGREVWRWEAAPLGAEK